MVPKIFHFVWVGDESKRPDNCIDTWRRHHPDWAVKIWGNAELHGFSWLNHRHMLEMYERELNGVADLMRWEILYAFGGFALDADSICLRPIDDALLDCPAFACWESEVMRPGLIAAGYVGAEAENPFIGQIVLDLADTPSVLTDRAWVTVGPQRLTDCYRKHAYTPMRIYPSHYFIPRHQTGLQYQGSDPVYADQLWGSTFGLYDAIHRMELKPEAAVAIAA